MSQFPKRYCVFGCDFLVTFCVPVHRFPHPIKKPDLFDAWVSVVGDKLDETDQMKIHKSKRLCDHHFDPIDKMSIDRIKPSAIPSVNLHRIQQGRTTFLQADHCYTHVPRGSVGSVPMMDIKNLPVPSRFVDTSRSPLPSGSMETTCMTGSDKSQFRILQTNLDADQESNVNPEFNPPLSNNENEPGTGESRRNEKTEVDNGNPYAEGIPDLNDDDDQESTFQNLQGSKPAQDPVFSWEKKVEEVPADDGDAVVCLENKETLEDLPPEISLYCDDDSSPDNEESDKVPEYQCNECREVITGFRYTCVQCADWDLCAACEARGAHDTHYVLRVPGQRPYSEIQAVLAAIRQQILSENLFLNPVDDSLKMEVKSELGEDPPGAESGPPPDPDSLPDLELLPDLDPLTVPDPIGEQRPDSENSSTDSSEESVSDEGSPSRTETPDQPFTHTEYLESSSDDSDASHSPIRKRKRTTPIETHENVAPKPAIVQDNSRLAGYTIKPRDTIALTCRQLTKVRASQIPRQILANVTVTSKPRASLARSVSRGNPTRFNQGVTRTLPNPASLLIPQQVIIEEPIESIAHQQVSTFVPSILKRGRPRTLELEEPTIHRTDHEREIIVESEQTPHFAEISELIQDARLEGNSERIQDSHLEENVEQLNEPSEFCLRLPAGTDEESLIQALQSPVTVRLKRDF